MDHQPEVEVLEHNPRVQNQLPADKRPTLDAPPNLDQVDDKFSAPEIQCVTVWPETDDELDLPATHYTRGW